HRLLFACASTNTITRDELISKSGSAKSIGQKRIFIKFNIMGRFASQIKFNAGKSRIMMPLPLKCIR
ncbi:MAG: hypothetical protein KAU83_02195, partial [Bacteroidales bacterium]|nr:hypothetical protein [Bacteroidales bacterium]